MPKKSSAHANFRKTPPSQTCLGSATLWNLNSKKKEKEFERNLDAVTELALTSEQDKALEIQDLRGELLEAKQAELRQREAQQKLSASNLQLEVQRSKEAPSYDHCHRSPLN